MAMSNDEIYLNGQGANNSNGKPTGLVAYAESLERLGGDVELFKEFIQIFFEDSPALLKAIFVSVDASDHEGLSSSAHALKGLVSNFGAKPCCELALEFELAGRNKVSEKMVGQKERMQHLYDRLCAELKQFST